MVDEKCRRIEQLIRRHVFRQLLLAVIVSSGCEVGAPFRHGFVHRSQFASRSALGMALTAGVFVEMAALVFAAFVSRDQS